MCFAAFVEVGKDQPGHGEQAPLAGRGQKEKEAMGVYHWSSSRCLAPTAPCPVLFLPVCPGCGSLVFGSWLFSATPKSQTRRCLCPSHCVLAALDAFQLPCQEGEHCRNTPEL